MKSRIVVVSVEIVDVCGVVQDSVLRVGLVMI